MTFDELLAQCAPQSQASWARLAQSEWRGRSAEDFDILFGSQDPPSAFAPKIKPFFSTESTVTVATEQNSHGQEGAEARRWTMLADLRHTSPDRATEQGELAGEWLLEALNGGAEGCFLEVERIDELASVAAEVRFDYIQLNLVVTGPEPQARPMLDPLSHLIPVDQSADIALRIPLPASDSQEVVRLLSRFPKLKWTILLTGQNAVAMVASLRAQLLELLAENRLAARHVLLPRLSIGYEAPTSYLEGVALPDALRVVFTAATQALVPPETFALPELIAMINPAGTVTPEAYLIEATLKLTAAISGGVNAGVVTPFDATERARREARNLQQVLALESGLALATDAVRGAIFFETAVQALVESSENSLEHAVVL